MHPEILSQGDVKTQNLVPIKKQLSADHCREVISNPSIIILYLLISDER
jgi:hypothetical protein